MSFDVFVTAGKRKNPYLHVFRKVEKQSCIHIRNMINIKIRSFPEGYTHERHNTYFACSLGLGLGLTLIS